MRVVISFTGLAVRHTSLAYKSTTQGLLPDQADCLFGRFAQ